MNEVIELRSPFKADKYTEYVCDKFDLQTRDEVKTQVQIPNLDELVGMQWNIGLIYGNSGSGKSTILRRLGYVGEYNGYDYDKPIISQFPNMSESEVCDLFNSIGLASVPVWMHKPNELSNGERVRLDLIASIANAREGEIIFVDEYTSVVNRDVAHSMSYCLQRYVRAKGLKIILASCHSDIIHWLTPDWVFNLNKTDSKGEVQIERLVYKNDETYDEYNAVNERDVVSDEYKVDANC